MTEHRSSSYIRYNTRATARALHIAVVNGHFQTVEHLLSNGAEVNLPYKSSSFKGFTPLCIAVLVGDEEIVKLLLSRGANANFILDDGISPLHIAVLKGYVQIVGYLLNHGADINFACRSSYLKDCAPLHLAVLNGNEEITKLLLSRGAHANCTQDEDLTPLHLAVQQGHFQILEHLLNHGAIVNCSCKRSPLNGFIPLQVAVQKGNEEITKLLLRRGAHVNCIQDDGLTPLHVAAHNGNFQVVEQLLGHGADVNSGCTSTSLMGFTPTPLHFAVLEGHEDVVKLLLVYRTNVNAKAGDRLTGWTALDGAEVETLLKCEKEVELMKREKIGSSNISFCDLLTVSKNQLAIYAMNKNIGLVLNSDECKGKFPIYATMINTRFTKGVERRKLLKKGSKLLYSLFKNLHQLPQNCIEQILSYLSDKHLKVLVGACI